MIHLSAPECDNHSYLTTSRKSVETGRWEEPPFGSLQVRNVPFNWSNCLRSGTHKNSQFLAVGNPGNYGQGPSKRGGLNGSTQHSARTHIALETKPKSPARLDQPERYPWLGFDRAQPNRSVSPGEVLSDQLIRWCCVDRLNWQRLPENWSASTALRFSSPISVFPNAGR